MGKGSSTTPSYIFHPAIRAWGTLASVNTQTVPMFQKRLNSTKTANGKLVISHWVSPALTGDYLLCENISYLLLVLCITHHMKINIHKNLPKPAWVELFIWKCSRRGTALFRDQRADGAVRLTGQVGSRQLAIHQATVGRVTSNMKRCQTEICRRRSAGHGREAAATLRRW